MAPSAFAGQCVVLFPYVASPLVLLEDIVNYVRPKFGVYFLGLLLVRPLHGSVLLFRKVRGCKKLLKGRTYPMKCSKSHVVHRHPDGTLPVVLALSKIGVGQGKTADAVWGPQVHRVAHQVQHGSQVRGRRVDKSEKEREEREVATVTFVI